MVILIGVGYEREHVSLKAVDEIRNSDIILAQTGTEHINDLLQEKEIHKYDKMDELEIIKLAIKLEKEGKKVSIITIGDPGIYDMASVAFQIIGKYSDVEFEIVPCVSALNYASSKLGAPLHDFATINLNDTLIPKEEIERKIEYSSLADMVIVLYNSNTKQDISLGNYCHLLLENKNSETPVGIFNNKTKHTRICKLKELKNVEMGYADTLIIGNSMTYVKKGKLITPHGHSMKTKLPENTEEFYNKFFKGDILMGQNTDCEYFPCHNDEESCTFCFCPFYPCAEGSTCGEWIEDKNVWSCVNCNWVHQNKVVDEVLDYIKENIKTMDDFETKKIELLKLRRKTIYKTRKIKYNHNYEV